MLYQYEIAGRTPGVIEQQVYKGTATADTPKEAILYALATEFGDRNLLLSPANAINALCESGWIDRETLAEQYSLLDDQDHSLGLDTGDHTFEIVVVPIRVPDEQVMKDWYLGLSDHEKCIWVAAAADNLSGEAKKVVDAVERPWRWHREAYYLAHNLNPILVEANHKDTYDVVLNKNLEPMGRKDH